MDFVHFSEAVSNKQLYPTKKIQLSLEQFAAQGSKLPLPQVSEDILDYGCRTLGTSKSFTVDLQRQSLSWMRKARLSQRTWLLSPESQPCLRNRPLCTGCHHVAGTKAVSLTLTSRTQDCPVPYQCNIRLKVSCWCWIQLDSLRWCRRTCDVRYRRHWWSPWVRMGRRLWEWCPTKWSQCAMWIKWTC